MEKYAVFLDIDGTYTSGSPVPVAKNVAAVERVRAAGHLVFANTGRSYGFIPKEVFAATELDGYIAGDGSYIKLGEQVIKNDRLSTELLVKLTAHLMNSELSCLFEGESDILCINCDRRDEAWQPVTSPEDFTGKFKDVAITKVTLFGKMSEADERIIEDNLHLIRFPTYCEAVIIGNNKAKGIEELLRHIGIPMSRCIAMGDSRNDLDMVKTAGIGVAMGNACDELKAVADYITCHAKDGGVAEALDHFLP